MKTGLPFVAGETPGLLILGSFPGEESLKLQQYYANPMNQFWRLTGALFGAHLELPYERRIARLKERGVALWDVLHACERDGSMDGNILKRTAIPNDIGRFLRERPSIRMIGLNGKTAAWFFERKFADPRSPSLQIAVLPSSSSAHAVTFNKKADAWSILTDFASSKSLND